MHFALINDFSIKQVEIVSRNGGFHIDSDGVRHPAPRLHHSREAAEDQGRKFLAAQEQQMSQMIVRHERRKKNVANY